MDLNEVRRVVLYDLYYRRVSGYFISEDGFDSNGVMTFYRHN